jgi:hypothetical protein
MRLPALPTVDLGPNYGGPVPSPGCSSYCGVCRFKDHPDAWPGPEPLNHRRSNLRLVEEIVCHQFHGSPPHGWEASRPHHRDGNDQNCAAENLIWMTDENVLEWQHFRRHKSLLRPGNLPTLVVGSIGGRAMGHYDGHPRFTESAGLLGHIPTFPLQIGA